MKRRDTGILGENLAKAYLENRGYYIIETNYRCPEGEIDIVARDGQSLVFVEVRTKRSLDFGTPEESITATKAKHLLASAQHYQQNRDNLPSLWRIDVVAIELGSGAKPRQITLIQNAISGE